MTDDWEDDDFEKPVKAEGASDDDDWDKSEDEDAPKKANWDDDDEDDWDKDTTKPVEEPVAKPAPAPKGPAAKSKEKAEIYVPLDDPIAEKARLRRLQEAADAALADDLFAEFTRKDSSPSKAVTSGTTAAASSSSPAKKQKQAEKQVVKDEWDDFTLDTADKVVEVMAKIQGKVEEVEKKAYMKGCINNLLTKLLVCVADKISLREAQDLEKKVKEIIRVRKVEQQTAQAAKTKINAVNKNTKFDVAGALDERYGYDDEDWDEDEEWEGEGGYYDESGAWVEGYYKEDGTWVTTKTTPAA
ncbi:unnamed protein product [Amoebophrya sp. A120]|nr:unnamed protein product [Amoebophrya sp. A120]|eukprot:GSA120T00012745001.1